MKNIFNIPYIAFCALFFYPSTILIWLCERPEMRSKGYFNVKEFIKHLHNELK